VGANLGRRARGEHAPKIQHRDLVADVEDQVGMMFDQQYGGAAPADRLDQRPQAFDLVAGQTRGRLVEQ